MTLSRLPACFLLLLSLQISTNASPLPRSPSPSPSSLSSSLDTLPLSPTHQQGFFDTFGSKIPPSFFLSKRDADSDEYGVPVTHPSGTKTVDSAAATASETAMTSPFQDSSSDMEESSNSKPLSPGVIAAIATVVSVLFAISLFALYRSQQRKNRRRDLSRTQEIEARREAAATRTSSRGGSLKSSQGEEGTLKVERAGSCSSQGTMVEVDVGLGERVVVQELGRKKSGGSR